MGVGRERERETEREVGCMAEHVVTQSLPFYTEKYPFNPHLPTQTRNNARHRRLLFGLSG